VADPRISPPSEESLARLLGGTRGAVDATLPVVGFVRGWLLAGRSVLAGAVAALAVAGGVAAWRLHHKERPRSVLIGLLAVCAAGVIAVYTGRAEDFFLVQIFANVASALVWVLSIALRWPLLGVVVGTVLGQKASWRRDPALLRAYGRASWVWVAQYVVRLAAFLPLWALARAAEGEEAFFWVLALSTARVGLTWPLVAVCLAVSWWVLRRSLPPGHPGLRSPVEA
jgi:hypothetical protein